MLRMTFGDNASGFSLRSKGSELKSRMEVLSKEISSGKVASVRKHTKGRVEEISIISRRSKNLEGYNLGIARLELLQKTAQISLGQIGGSLQALRDDAVLFQTSSSPSARKTLLEKSELVLERMISALNVSVAGESVFSGTATDRAPLDLEGLTAAVKAHVLTRPASQSLGDRVDEFFLTAGPYETQAYSGSSAERSFLIDDGRTVGVGVRADGIEIRRAIGAVMGVMIALDDTISIPEAQRKDVVSHSIARMSSAMDSVIAVKARLGASQENLELQKTANTAQIESLKMLQSEKLGVDRYAKIAELREAENRLGTVYAMTARMSRLSLLEYIK